MKSKGQWSGAMGAALLTSQPAWAEYAYSLRAPASQAMQDAYPLHSLIILACLAVFVAVFGAMFYSLLKHRKSVGHQSAHFHENTTAEVIWTAIPFVILMAAAYPATKTIIDPHVVDNRQYDEQQVASR